MLTNSVVDRHDAIVRMRGVCDVCDKAYHRCLSSGPTRRATHAVWTKSYSSNFRTKCRQATNGKRSVRRKEDLQTLRKD